MAREFSANVSHELKTPLHTISGCAELMANGMVRQEDMVKFSTQIYTESCFSYKELYVNKLTAGNTLPKQ